MKPKKNRKKFLITSCVILAIIILMCYWQNNSITTTRIDYSNTKIPSSFHEFVIAQISDLHNKEFGDKQSKLVQAVMDAKPDIIVVTGDLIDSNKTNIDVAMEFIEQAALIAPIYYVSGNHEKWSGVYDKLTNILIQAGVTILDDQSALLERNGETISLIGLQDPAFTPSDYIDQSHTYIFEEKLESLSNPVPPNFNILLSHRPELMDVYSNKNIDLVFAGHAHGGQFRIPFVGGLIAPDQGFFPQYTSGIYVEGETSMIVSRGLGNSIIPLRILNQPELVVVTLKSKQ